MLKKTITYTDWNGTERTEDFYFNLTRTEIMEIEYGLGTGNGKSFSDSMSTIIKSKDMSVIIKAIKNIILMAYGEKSQDGRRFIKNDELREAFEQNPAFDILYMEMSTNAEYASDFITGIMPASMREQLGANPSQKLLERMETFEKTQNM